MEKYRTAGHATDYNMAHAHCMMDTLGYKHALIVCNTAFPLQQCSHERGSLFCYTYIACIVVFMNRRIIRCFCHHHGHHHHHR